MADHWGYSHSNGPDQWPKLYGSGSLQSPINILVPGCNRIATSTCCNCPQQQLPEPQVASLAGQLHRKLHVEPNRRAHLNSTGEESMSSPNESPNLRDEDEESDYSECDSARMRDCKHSQDTRHCKSNRKIFLGYPRYLQKLRLRNTGHGWQAELPTELAAHNLIAGPPFGDREYRLAQFHCHWGEDCDRGSEHQINGKSFSAEIHFVHWNCSQFDSIEKASKRKHGLAVLGVMVQALEGEQNRNKHLDKIIAALKRIQSPGASVEIDARLDMKKLFPANRWAYASYEGSLTTPPLSEVVDWVVFLNPIQCSTSQIEQFRHLRCPGAETKPDNLVKNCRSVQPTNNRLVTIWSHH